MQIDADRKQEYRQAYQAWQRQLENLHRVVLDDESMEPPKLKGLLHREARAKERYDAARGALLGVEIRQADDPFGL